MDFRKVVFKQYSLIIIVTILLVGCDNTSDEPSSGFDKRPPTLVVTGTVEEQFIADEIEAIGTLEANESVVITAAVTESVDSVNFKDGQQVSQGDVLVRLVNDEQAGELAEARANLEDAERQLKRLEAIGNNLASKSLIDEARAQVAVYRGRLEAIRARLKDRIITAPFSGVLGFRQVSVGALVTPGTAITTLDDISVVKLDFSIPETHLGKLRLDNPVIGASPAWPNQEFSGRVVTIDSRVDANTRAVRVRAELENPEHKLKPGMLMNVTLFTDQYPALLVPETALLQTGNRSSVYVVNEDQTVALRQVVVAKRTPGFVVLRDGVEVGEQVVVNGTLNLRPGAEVRVQNRDQSANNPANNPNSPARLRVAQAQ